MINTHLNKMTIAWKRLYHELTSPDGTLRHLYNPLLDLPKLIFQTTTLVTYLHEGFPVALGFIYSCLLFTNWLISSYRYTTRRSDPHYVVARIFYSFDLFFAVFAPLEVFLYSYYTFEFNRDEFATREATINTSKFDRTARFFADPTQISLFRIAFHYLQLTTSSGLLIKIALNLLSVFKWWTTIVHLVQHAHETPQHENTEKLPPEEHKERHRKRRRQRLESWIIASVFLFTGASVLIHSIVAVESTNNVCRRHTQCKVRSFRWNIGADKCSCIVFIDHNTRVTTFAEWENPEDTTLNLAALASTGNSKIVQIINRQVPVLPVELRRCQHLEQLILMYTKTDSIPDWVQEFSHLEYLHIQGDHTPKQLEYIHENLFVNMHNLMFLHLGTLLKIKYIPHLSHLHRLVYLVLAVDHTVTQIPSLDNLENLRKLSLIDMIGVTELPPVRKLKKLTWFALTNRNPVCCNGLLTGVCDLTRFSCLDRTFYGETLVTCTEKRISKEDNYTLQATEGQVCEKNQTLDLQNARPTLLSTDTACGGVMYKRCTLRGVSGICFPSRMQAIACQANQMYVNMRRLQIERGVGEPCDPTIEGWLGCR